jgi:CRP-like cAMP-binding protein
MIDTGKVKITRMVQKTEVELKILSAGEFVGEMAIIDSEPRSANALAMEECKLIKMDKASFEETLQNNSLFAENFVRFLSKRLRQNNEIIKSLTEENRRGKFYIEVMKEFISSGKKDKSGKYLLLELQSFLNTFKERHKGDYDKFWTVLEQLLAEGEIKLRKDDKKITWISINI